MIISTKWPQNKYLKNSYLRKLPTDFRNLFFVFFLKSRRTRRNQNLTHFIQLKISYGQATSNKTDTEDFDNRHEYSTGMLDPLTAILVTARKRSLGQGNISAPVILFRGGIPVCLAGGIPACLAAGLGGGSPGPHPGGKLRGLARGGSPGPHPGRGLQAHIWGWLGVCIPACTEANPSIPDMDGYYRRR